MSVTSDQEHNYTVLMDLWRHLSKAAFKYEDTLLANQQQAKVSRDQTPIGVSLSS